MKYLMRKCCQITIDIAASANKFTLLEIIRYSYPIERFLISRVTPYNSASLRCRRHRVFSHSCLAIYGTCHISLLQVCSERYNNTKFIGCLLYGGQKGT